MAMDASRCMQHALPKRQLLQALRSQFGFDSFRPFQEEAIMATLEGRDSLLILPTGGGKSLTFQLPALAKGNGFTVVIGPLMALAKDQVDSCIDRGIDARVWNSDTSEVARRQVLSELASEEPDLRLLYTTPESLRNPTLRSYLQEASICGKLLSFAVDEAHCVSEWGHDFRPAYLELATLKRDFPKTPIAALTASCTPAVEASITKLLQMNNPLVIKGGFNRPNIQYKVVFKELIGAGKQDDVLDHLLDYIRSRPGQCGIIYARLRTTCDWLCSTLGNCDVDAGCYHAGKDAARRRQVQQEWCEGGLDIVVATVAFGMGIDRPDVRWVVHWDAPSSLEGFYQESGRAGRDGLPSESVLYVGADDLDTITKLEKNSRAGAAAAVANFSCQPGCKRKKILEYFSQHRGSCDANMKEQLCDYCNQPQVTRQLMQEWEQQISRKNVQLTMKQQRVKAEVAATDDDHNRDDMLDKEPANNGLSWSLDRSAAGTSNKVVGLLSRQAGKLTTVQQQQKAPGPQARLWSLARLHASPMLHAASATCKNNTSNTHSVASSGSSSAMECSSVVQPLQMVIQQQQQQPACEPLQHDAICAATATCGTAVVTQQLSAGPVVVPRLMRKRSCSQGTGAFKVPRLTSDTTAAQNPSTILLQIDKQDSQQLPEAGDMHHSNTCNSGWPGTGDAPGGGPQQMPVVPRLGRTASAANRMFRPPLKPATV